MTNVPPWARREEAPALELIEPNEDERKNGWDAESLTKYVHEASARQNTLIGVTRRQPIRRCARPMKWLVASGRFRIH